MINTGKIRDQSGLVKNKIIVRKNFIAAAEKRSADHNGLA